MGDLQEVKSGNISSPESGRDKTYIYEDEIVLIDYLRILWKHKFFIFFCSLLPVLIAGIVIYLLPKSYKVSYTYDMIISGKDSKKLLDKFYSQENLNRIIAELTRSGFSRYAEMISKADTINRLNNLISFQVLSFSPETKEDIITSDIENTTQNRINTGELLKLTVSGDVLENITEISSVIRENFQDTIPMYSVKNELNKNIISIKAEMANIEKNRFNLNLELKTKNSILAKLKDLKHDVTTDMVNDVILQFDNIDKNSEYLPLAYQIQAADANIINIEETIKANQQKYNYYNFLLNLNEKIYSVITEKDSPYSNIRPFHSFLIGLENDFTNQDQVNYLKAYTKKIENIMSTNTPILEKPKIYPVPRHLVQKCSVIFAASLIISTILAFTMELLRKKPLERQ